MTTRPGLGEAVTARLGAARADAERQAQANRPDYAAELARLERLTTDHGAVSTPAFRATAARRMTWLRSRITNHNNGGTTA